MARIGPSTGTRAERVLRMMLVRSRARHRTQVKWGPENRWCCDFKVGAVLVDVHGHHWHARTSSMRRMSEFWREKLRKNRERDRKKVRYARENGIAYVVIWEHELRSDGTFGGPGGHRLLKRWLKFELTKQRRTK